ncbi:MAG TPA: FtsX-like permease family protein [Gemmatimonadaceae bacterium]|nr:FtsX-like permease family protein [Gemmatimonadaceae bacterium]
MRTALGAGRGRLVRQIVTESVLLSLTGAVLGALLATWAVDAVVAFGPRGLPRLDEVAVDGRVLAFTAVVALATGIVFGLVPALHVARPDISQMLKTSVRGSSRGGVHRTRSLLVASEMALAVVLLVGAGLLLRSFARLTHVDPGFRTANVVSFKVTMPDTKYKFDRQKINFANQLTEQLRSMPGTEAVAVTFGRPLDRIRFRTTFDIAGLPPNPPEKRMVTEVRTATAEYFRTLGIPLRRGRLYTADEDRPGAQLIVVSEEFARRYFKGEDAVGKRITLGISHDTAGDSTQVTSGGEIVGVVGDVKQGDLAEEEYPTAYVPYNSFPLGDAAVLVRTAADPAALERAAPGIVRALDADMPVYDVRRMDDVVADSVSQPRFYTMLLGGFAAIALLLAAVGIYGVISYVVSLRTREIGIRVALGASRGRIVNLVIGRGLVLTLAGVAVGLAAAFWMTRAISSLLFGVSALDPLTYAGVSLVLVGVAVLASYVPARRAARVDPVLAMRSDG